jgi:hypothetical protein
VYLLYSKGMIVVSNFQYLANLYTGELHQLIIGRMDIGVLRKFTNARRLDVCGFMLQYFHAGFGGCVLGIVL